ncbi:hypothetical protein M514_27666 [Trichuris suis]|uniref:Reverse transcriptase domain-containing protein n=1 Tax=Trichuris suis TaxID=68888 RepID=A0A085MSG7_9BILA|nr:hypothetical protein M514_27666 [Trichuris suis]
MGSRLSPILLEVFMEHLERAAFATVDSDVSPSFFKRYVDDIFASITAGKEEVFLEHLNKLLHGKIELTMEKQSNNR